MAHFIDCYAECHYADCRGAECRYAVYQYVDCNGTLTNLSFLHVAATIRPFKTVKLECLSLSVTSALF